MRSLAEKLVDAEARGNSAFAAQGSEAIRVYDKLRASLTRVAGFEGFSALARRSLALAKADTPSLADVKILPKGSIDGLEQVIATEEDGREAAITVIANLLDLLVVFIGETLTLRLIGENWLGAELTGELPASTVELEMENK